MAEFDLIALIHELGENDRSDVLLGIGDDAAVLRVAEGMDLVTCVDTLVAGVHFLPATTAWDLGWKSLAVNLSDLAAMGASPAWAQLALTLPTSDQAFVRDFIHGFLALAQREGVALVGGDTTRGELAFSVTAYGLVPSGQVLRRGGARPGDHILVCGALGEAAGGLAYLQAGGDGSGLHTRSSAPRRERLVQRLHRPEPMLAAGQLLRGRASACIDISDGLLSDLGHLCTASNVGAELRLDALPRSEDLCALFNAEEVVDLVLAGGDDYALCCTVPEALLVAVQDDLAGREIETHMIGRVVSERGVTILDRSGHTFTPRRRGYEHFSA